MTRRRFVLLGGAMLGVLALGSPWAAGAAAADDNEVTVYKSPSCGCCGAWVEHLRANGFSVAVEETDDLEPVKQRLGVPEALRSCHTATVGGYVIEGHVPAADIRRLLATRPAGTGLAVPGMPQGSPGMEQGGGSEPYTVILFGDGAPSAFARY